MSSPYRLRIQRGNLSVTDILTDNKIERKVMFNKGLHGLACYMNSLFTHTFDAVLAFLGTVIYLVETLINKQIYIWETIQRLKVC